MDKLKESAFEEYVKVKGDKYEIIYDLVDVMEDVMKDKEILYTILKMIGGEKRWELAQQLVRDYDLDEVFENLLDLHKFDSEHKYF